MKIDTKMPWLATCVVAAALCATSTAVAQDPVASGAVTVVDKLPFPEAPLFVNDRLHWVEYISNRLMRLDGETRTVLHEQEGCGHNGLSLSPSGQLVVICYESNEILYLDLDGNVVDHVDVIIIDRSWSHIRAGFECVASPLIVWPLQMEAPYEFHFIQIKSEQAIETR